jgi:hypothetical protein
VLKGHPSVHEFVRLVKTRSRNGHCLDDLALTREWQAANSHLRETESDDACTLADAGLPPLPLDSRSYAAKVLEDPCLSRSLGFLPPVWAMVDLSKILVCQHYVDDSHVAGIRQSLPARPSVEDLIRVAASVDTHSAPVDLVALNNGTFSFSSPSTDLRVLGAIALDPAEVKSYQPFGKATSLLGVYVGYSANVMWAVQANRRLLLINGTHRAFALLTSGIQHVPCLVSRISRPDEWDLIGAPDVKDNLPSLVQRKRPPLLKDYLDTRFHKVIEVPRVRYSIELELKFHRSRVVTDST